MSKHHYFVSSFDVWVTDKDLNLALKRFWKDSRSPTATIYRVPGPSSERYRIEYYAPQVDGAIFLDRVFRSETARKKDSDLMTLIDEYWSKHELAVVELAEEEPF